MPVFELVGCPFKLYVSDSAGDICRDANLVFPNCPFKLFTPPH